LIFELEEIKELAAWTVGAHETREVPNGQIWAEISPQLFTNRELRGLRGDEDALATASSHEGAWGIAVATASASDGLLGVRASSWPPPRPVQIQAWPR
jgi:hypothetical protein